MLIDLMLQSATPITSSQLPLQVVCFAVFCVICFFWVVLSVSNVFSFNLSSVRIFQRIPT